MALKFGTKYVVLTIDQYFSLFFQLLMFLVGHDVILTKDCIMVSMLWLEIHVISSMTVTAYPGVFLLVLGASFC